MSTPKISRQRAYQIRHAEAGLCLLCSEKAEPHGIHCTRHRELKTKRQREKGGYKPWKKGGPGRPPKASSGKKTDNDYREAASII